MHRITGDYKFGSTGKKSVVPATTIPSSPGRAALIRSLQEWRPSCTWHDLRASPVVNNYVNDDELDEYSGTPWQPPSRRRPKTTRCQRCKAKIKIKTRGRVPRFCSATSRQLAYEQRKWQRPTPVELAAKFRASYEVRSTIRDELWSMLQAAGLIAPNQPPPALPRKSRPRAHLRVVEREPEHKLPDSPSELPKPPQDN